MSHGRACPAGPPGSEPGVQPRWATRMSLTVFALVMHGHVFVAGDGG
jgi:hypothetical protein